MKSNNNESWSLSSKVTYEVRMDELSDTWTTKLVCIYQYNEFRDIILVMESIVIYLDRQLREIKYIAANKLHPCITSISYFTQDFSQNGFVIVFSANKTSSRREWRCKELYSGENRSS